jgi:hypothetical protein
LFFAPAIWPIYQAKSAQPHMYCVVRLYQVGCHMRQLM